MAKIKNLYNLSSFDEAKKVLSASDSAGVILGRNLEHISGEVFEQKIASLTFLSQSGITINNEGGYADSITKLKVGYEGDFALSGTDTSNNGKISISGENDTMSVFYKEANSEWSEFDIERAKLQNINLVSRFLMGHDRKYKENIDTIGYLGQSGKSEGLLNHSSFTTSVSSDIFSNLNGKAMYEEVAELIDSQRSAVNFEAEFSCDKIVLTPGTYNRMNRTFMEFSGSGLSTVIDAIKKNFNIVFVTTHKADIDGAKRMVAYSSDRQCLQKRIPTPLRISTQYQKGFKYYIESAFGVAGLDVLETAGAKILTGV